MFKTVLHFGLSRQKNNFVSKDADSILPPSALSAETNIILFDSIRPRSRTMFFTPPVLPLRDFIPLKDEGVRRWLSLHKAPF